MTPNLGLRGPSEEAPRISGLRKIQEMQTQWGVSRVLRSSFWGSENLDLVIGISNSDIWGLGQIIRLRRPFGT